MSQTSLKTFVKMLFKLQFIFEFIHGLFKRNFEHFNFMK